MKKCLVCNSTSLKDIINLGIHPNSDTFIPKNLLGSLEPLEYLICSLCQKCGMVQNKNIIEEFKRYNLYDYSYTSANSKYARDHWSTFADFVYKELELNKESKLLEIGSNDGFLSKEFIKKKIKTICIDASKAMVNLSRRKGLKTYLGVFNHQISRDIKNKEGLFNVVIANNVFNHSNEPKNFLKGVSNLLINNGHVVFEVLYWKDMVIDRRFDQIYHEHVSYFTVKSINELLLRNNFIITKVYNNEYHGGTLRIIAQKNNQKITNAEVKKYIKNENKIGLFKLKTYVKFQKEINDLKIKFNSKIFYTLNRGYKIIGIGAGAKSNTFLNFMKLDHNIITCITDVSKFKINKYMPLSRIPIKNDTVIKKYKKVCALILSWNINENLNKKLKKIKKNIKVISQTNF